MKRRIVISPSSLLIVGLAVLFIVAAPFLVDNPDFISFMRSTGIVAEIPHSNTLFPFSNHLSYSVMGFEPVHEMEKRFCASEGQNLIVHYWVKFDENRPKHPTDTPIIAIRHPLKFESIWWVNVEQSVKDAKEKIQIPFTGCYTISLNPWGFNGDFDIWWEIEKQ